MTEERRRVEASVRWVRGYEWEIKDQRYVQYDDEEWREYFSLTHNAWLRDRREGSVRKVEP